MNFKKFGIGTNLPKEGNRNKRRKQRSPEEMENILLDPGRERLPCLKVAENLAILFPTNG